MSLNPGDTVGEYKIVEAIGSGATGRVFLVEHLITRRREAMKVLSPGITGPSEQQRFLHEIQLQASLNHPNIAAVHNAFWAGDDLVLIMELVDGSSLASRLEAGRIPLEEGLAYTRQALRALAYAHEHGMVHRDVSPGNILITPAGVVKLTDFGLAKTSGDPKLTQTGAVVGSLYYTSPEQIRASATLDARGDIYSLGAILYHVATGQKPFKAEHAYALMVAHVEQAPVPPIELNPALPPELNAAILKAMEKDPARRFQNADDFWQVLDALSRAGIPAASLRARKRAIGIGAIVTLVALSAVGILLLNRAQNRSQPVGQTNIPAATLPPPPAPPSQQPPLQSTPASDPGVQQPLAPSTPSPAPAGVKPQSAPPVKPDAAAAHAPRPAPPQTLPTFRPVPGLKLDAAVWTVTFSPDGSWLAAGTERNNIEIFDAATSQRLTGLEGHKAGVSALVFSPDNRTVASGSSDGELKLWDFTERRAQATYRQGRFITAIAFSPDSQWLASGSSDKRVLLRNLVRGTSRELRDHKEEPQALVFSPNGRVLASASSEKTVRLWAVEPGRVVTRLKGLDRGADRAIFSPDGRRLLLAGPGRFKVWDLEHQTELESPEPPGVLRSLVFARDGRCLAVLQSEGALQLWDVAASKELATLPYTQRIRSTALSPDGRKLAVTSESGRLQVWELR